MASHQGPGPREREGDASGASPALPARGPLAILYTDIVGSTAMNRILGDDRAREKLHAHDQIVRRCLARHSGVELQPTGDGFKLAFARPADAVRCAASIQLELAELDDDSEGERIRIRIGIHTGEPLREKDDVFGEAVIIAHRVMARATGGQVLITEATRARAGKIEPLRYVDRGLYHLKGIEEGIRLFEVLWAAEPAPTREPARPGLPLPWRGTPFVGRIAELRALEELLDEAESGRGSVALLAGEAGIGKSRLAFEFVHALSKRAHVLCWGRCFPDLGGPLRPVLDGLRRLREALPDLRPPPEVADDLAPLRHLAPDLAGWIGGSQGSELALPREEEWLRLLAALDRLFVSVTREHTLLFLVDDVQWSDEQTLDLLRFLGRRLAPELDDEGRRLLIVLTCRESEVEPGALLGQMLAGFERARCLVRIPLAGLPAPDLDHLVGGLCGTLPARPFLTYVRERSQGNPYFAEEIVRDAAERSTLHPADASWTRTALGAERPVPRGVKTVLEQRLSRISGTSLGVFRTAALLGTSFSLDALRAASEKDEEQVLRALDEGHAAHVVQEEPDGETISFYHSLVAEVLSEQLSSARRRALHARIARALESLYGETAPQHASELAHHLERAGPLASADSTLRHATRAGDRASAVYAFGEATRWYAVALMAMERIGSADALVRAELQRKRALALGRTGRMDEARELADAAIGVFARAGRSRQVAAACDAVASSLILHARHRDALPYLERALGIGAESVDALRGRRLAQYATALDLTGRSDEMRTTAEELLAVAARLRNPELRERALLIERNWYANHTTEVAKARSLTARVLRSAERRGDAWDQTLHLESLALFELSLGRLDRALDVLDRALELAGRTGALAKIIDVRGLRALCFCHRGEWARVDEEWAQASPLVGQVPGAIHLGQLLWARARTDLWLGRPTLSAPSPARAYPGLSQLETAVLAVAGLVASERGDPSAPDLLGAAAKRHPHDGVGLNWMLAAQMLAAGWVNLGRSDEAVAWYPGLVRYRRILSLTFTALELARIAASSGWWERSTENFSIALSIARREGLRPHIAIARLERGLMWWARGERRSQARARREIEAAREDLAALGMNAQLERMERLHALGEQT